MVLQEAVGGKPDDFPTSSSSDAPSSDEDPFASPFSENPINYHVSATDLPRPVPILGPILGYGQRALEFRTKQMISGSHRFLGRPMTQDEVLATAQHQARALQISSYGGSSGFLMGAYLCYKSAPQYKFPFQRARVMEEFNPDVFGPLKGQAARIARHSLRATMYLALGVLFGDMLFQGYATANLAREFYRDPRLSEVVDSMKKMASSAQARAATLNQSRPESSQEQRQVQSGDSSGGWFGGRRDVDDDDMSPRASSDSDLLSDEDMRRQQMAEQARRRIMEEREASISTERARTQSQRYDDDGSPTASPSTPASGSGSAWDRIRQGVSSGQTQASGARSSWPSRDQARASQQGSSLGDSFSFSSSDEERQLEKGEAQREFDARVERERQGRSFNDESKRW